MDLSVVLVDYHTPELAAEAVAALRDDAQGSGLAMPEILVVDNGNTPETRRRLEAIEGARVLGPGTVSNYAAGLNRGVEESSGRVLVLMNTDVFVRPGCLAALTAELDRGAWVVGPRVFWDRTERLLLPPTEERTPGAELLRRLAGASPRAATFTRWARRRWRRRARRVWATEEPVDGLDLSGAMLATTREVWRRVGPFDPAYRLYFEESDWLERLGAAGGVGRHVPAARAVHLYDQSAGAEPASRDWFVASARRFERLHYPAWFPWAARWVALWPGGGTESPKSQSPKSLAPLGSAPDGGPPRLDLTELGDGPLWIEISPSSQGFPAAAERLAPGTREWRPPEEIWRRLGPEPHRVAVVDGEGMERRVWSIQGAGG
jgi:GT2 family glycosyltransferase